MIDLIGEWPRCKNTATPVTSARGGGGLRHRCGRAREQLNDSRLVWAGLLAALLTISMGASYRGANFVVETDDSQMAARISKAAEQFRHDLAIE